MFSASLKFDRVYFSIC